MHVEMKADLPRWCACASHGGPNLICQYSSMPEQMNALYTICLLCLRMYSVVLVTYKIQNICLTVI